MPGCAIFSPLARQPKMMHKTPLLLWSFCAWNKVKGIGVTMNRLFERREAGVLCILLVLGIALAVYSPAFLTQVNIKNILVNNSALAIMAVGMTLVLITGGIDVSVASQMMFSATLLAEFSFLPFANPFTIVLAAIVIGAVTGSINGLLISHFNIDPIIITLGTNSIYRGIILVYTSGRWIMNLPGWFTAFSKTVGGVLPLPVVYVVLLLVLTAYILRYTSFGRAVYACGGNVEAARRAGINVNRTIFRTYAYTGVLCGIAGLVQDSILGNCQPAGSNGWEMNVIAAAVIGGTNILGGSGTMAGTAIGVLLMGVIENGLVVAHVPTYWQKLVYGVIIIMTVTIDILRKNRADAGHQLIEID